MKREPPPSLGRPRFVSRPEHEPTPAPAGARETSVYLHPGQLHAAAEPCTITTVLGSCVSVCLFDRVLRIGGANHFLLPTRLGYAADSPRVAAAAIQLLIDRLVALGSKPGTLDGKIFGGACVLAALSAGQRHLGGENVAIARRLLSERGIPIIAEDVGGQRGRKLVFRSDSGDAWVRLL